MYSEAQKVDEWEGEDYDGTSVRAGAKILQQMGYISQYLWAWDIETVLSTLLNVGPVVVGTLWYESMFDPDPLYGLVKIEGEAVGGHAYVLNGVNLNSGLIRAKNSWSKEWGKNGHFRIKIEDFERLLHEDGEACIATEVPLLLP
jgi:hypothetical protein